MQLQYATYNLPFKHPFTISKGTKTHQPTFVVSLQHLGFEGIGEAPAIAYYDVTVDGLAVVAQHKKMFIEKFAFTEPGRYWHYLHHLLPKHPFLVCALDIAGWDLWGKMKGKKLNELWPLPAKEETPLTSYTIGIDSIEKMLEKVAEKPWPIYKIKLGSGNDVAIVDALRRATSAKIRVDANAAWTKEQALEIITALKGLDVEFIEQPLAKDDWEGMAWLKDRSPLPLIADESCVFESDVAKCAEHFHGINIKLTKCSGVTPALRMIEAARGLNLQVMLGCMNESSIGSAALAHLAPLADYLDADGPLLLTEDVATGLCYNDGMVHVSDAPGLGVQWQR